MIKNRSAVNILLSMDILVLIFFAIINNTGVDTLALPPCAHVQEFLQEGAKLLPIVLIPVYQEISWTDIC